MNAHTSHDGPARSAEPQISLDGVSKVYESESGPVEALRDVHFDVEAGEFVSIVGPSGSGKSTAFRIVAGLEAATEGRVLVGGEPVTGPGPDRGMVFQDDALFPWRTVAGNVAYGLEEVGPPEGFTVDERIEYCLDLVGLADKTDAYPKELSGGQRQRVGIARALAVDPPILLMDEPFGSVDARTKTSLHRELLDIWRETRKTICFVTHDIEEAVYLSDRIVVFSNAPGTVLDVIDVDLERPRDRTGDAFTEIKGEVLAYFQDGE
ncbi:ABC transporter ATP-binding protein [Halomicrobium sp. LC1Hm]|uniref:ABC transporter ATP-binding protein n=1 Tax=Halomicrobium sp. LC1Hm TaxID=2610902 RepID=UPI001C3F6AD1|nr:ABC transporter ATP-binding protein [Halomicrobium sp. LC1Hm]